MRRLQVYLRQLCKALDHEDVRELVDAAAFAEKRGKPLNTTLIIHPKLLAIYPDDIGHWLSAWFLNRLRIWCERDRGFGYFAIWVRESYEGERREHVHLLLYVPDRERPALEDTLRCLLVGDERVVDVGVPRYSRDQYGRRTNKALTYMLKQMDPKARFALGFRVRREEKCRDDDAPVAAVLGKRCGVSRSLNARTRATFWSDRQGERGAPSRAQSGERRRAGSPCRLSPLGYWAGTAWAGRNRAARNDEKNSARHSCV